MMSTLTTTTSRLGVSLPRVANSEWIKLRSVRSTMIGFGLTVLILVGVGMITSATMGESLATGAMDDDGPPFQPSTAAGATMGGVAFAQVLTGALGVLAASVEYSTGLLRATLSAVPTRLPVLFAKCLVFGAVVFAISLAAVFAAFFAGSALLSSHGVAPSISDPGVLRMLLATPIYLAGVGVLGICFAVLMRSTAMAVSAISFVVFLLDSLAGMLLPGSLGDTVPKYLPASAGNAFITAEPGPDLLSAGAGMLVFGLYVVLAVAAAALALSRRDV